MLKYNFYRGDSSGGPIDWSGAYATADGPPWSPPPLAPGESRWYGVRTVDEGSGLEEQGTAARVFLAVDAAGRDVANPPAGPAALTATPGAIGEVVVAWTYLGRPDRPAPASWSIWVQAGPAIDYTLDPAATVPASAVGSSFRRSVSGLTPGASYVAGVRGILGYADDGNTLVARVDLPTGPPPAVEDLTVEAISGDA